jgi:rhamnogalacturonyl hydrolase YesR
MSAVLEDYLNYKKDDAVLDLVDEVGDYILNRQERLPNRMFYREMEGHLFQNTIWADDLYMSTPFLMRYSILKNDKSVLDDVINQFMCFKEYLYMPDKKLMSHVYNLNFNKQTEVPWGRGNGWVLFSLSELLQVMSVGHKDYAKIKEFFVELCEGFLGICDENGMCHQVLDDHESYAEASSTAMCAVAFSRGIMMGILPKEKYGTMAKKSVEALKEYCIDEDGNVYGVCIGSLYSFTREYYKYSLPWNKNDTHGTGIILMALAETEKIIES